MNMLKPKSLSVLLGCLFLFLSCSVEESNFKIEESTINVKFINESSDFEEVNIEIKDVLLRTLFDKNNSDCWISLNTSSNNMQQVLDVSKNNELFLVNDLKLVSSDVYEIKLLLGSNNSIELDGKNLILETPFVHQTGLEIEMEEFLEPNRNYLFTLTMDVNASILQTNTPDYIILKPQVTASVNSY